MWTSIRKSLSIVLLCLSPVLVSSSAATESILKTDSLETITNFEMTSLQGDIFLLLKKEHKGSEEDLFCALSILTRRFSFPLEKGEESPREIEYWSKVIKSKSKEDFMIMFKKSKHSKIALINLRKKLFNSNPYEL